MYARQSEKNHLSREIAIPQNYRGTAFKESEVIQVEEDAKEEESTEAALPVRPDERKITRSFLSSEEDIILLGLILLLAQEELSSEILPILIMILFLNK